MDTLREKLATVGQTHLLKYYDELSEDKRRALLESLASVDWDRLRDIYKHEVSTQLDETGTKLKPVAKIDDDLIEELPDSCIEGTMICADEKIKMYESIGCESLRTGKVAALLLAGGQGTRLGVDYPKGMFNVGEPVNKSLFQLQAERISRLKTSTQSSRIIWYIMTSEATMERTKSFFMENHYFGISQDEVVFFEQGTMPCLSFDGKVLLDERHKISRSPDGNGGLYEALRVRGIIDHMKRNSVEFVHAYCVDNILVRVCDPKFMGYCISKEVDVGAKIIEKKSPNESVGTICKVQGQFKVIEYSEISEKIASKLREPSGKLAFDAGNICDHFFRVQFLDTVANGPTKLRYHLAIKKIPHVDLETNQRIDAPPEPCGIKLEKFIFDVFEFTQKFAAWKVSREHEFAPLKNADGSQKDNPTTAREALTRVLSGDIGQSSYIGFE